MNTTVIMKHFLITNYENYKGGILNLQVSTICKDAAGGAPVRRFTSTKQVAKSRAKSWAKKNNIELIAY